MKYNELIGDNSVWISATPSENIKKLPFYITEIGHFFAENGYAVSRDYHESFLFLYTVKGSGEVESDGKRITLDEKSAIIIDCRVSHKYFASENGWDFIWFHFNSCSGDSLYELLYDGCIRAITVINGKAIMGILSSLLKQVERTSLINGADISVKLHEIVNILISSESESESSMQSSEISDAIRFIKEHYAESITIENIIEKIHLSKYHFIRIFRKVTGVTPYSYLMNYRINQAKLMLHSSEKTVAEIAEECGYLDTSNFISYFKKRTGETPLQYRHNFF